jgi:F0F1-type ATP synthase assembly protein I
MMDGGNKKAIALAVALATELTAMVLIGIFGGQYLGRQIGFADLGAIIGCALGFGIWTWRLIITKRYIL